MVVFVSLVVALLRLINFVIGIYIWVIIADALVSWVEPNPYNPVVRTLRMLTYPVLYPFRKLQRKLFRYRLPVDLSPLFAILALVFVRIFLLELTWRLAGSGL